MGLFEEADAGGDDVGDVLFGEFHLEVHGVEVGSVEDGDITEMVAFGEEAVDAFDDEGGLLSGIWDGDDEGFFRFGFGGKERFGEGGV